ncbi:unnamed protein product, partial [Owenia fusiformis]
QIDYFNENFFEKMQTFIHDSQNISLDEPIDLLSDIIINGPIQTSEVCMALKRINSNRSPGIDGIPSDIIKIPKVLLCPLQHSLTPSLKKGSIQINGALECFHHYLSKEVDSLLIIIEE